MDTKTDYISEFEELLKLREFDKDEKMEMALSFTYEKIAKALKSEYTENINEKIARWVNITHVQYFKNVESITYYFQAKMLYRDGFYESAIMLVRSICEMICYDLLSKTSHPFGDLELIDVPTFRVFVNFLAIPKKIDKDIFENQIVANTTELDDKNFIKSSYNFDNTSKVYEFKIENSKKNSNLERFFRLFRAACFNNIDTFEIDIYNSLHHVYDIGNLYVHAKSKSNPPKEDAAKCLNMLTDILYSIYGITSLSAGKTVKSGYSDFPDICKGNNLAMEVATTHDEARRIYCNIPHPKYVNLLMQTVGVWNGEWKDQKGKNIKGILTFVLATEEFLTAILKYTNENKEEINEPMDIKLFGNYFHLKGFDADDMQHKKGKHVFFELEFFSNDLMLGENIDFQGKVIFRRTT
ncbi:MAG: hypothetical protein PHF20_07510 [Halothiobacillaceae bacterium]|nr:hypothetical protein [Halothiobacillaceae bacterium]